MSSQLSQKLTQLLKDAPKPLHMHEPTFDKAEQKYALECIETGWVSSAGSYVERFSNDLQEFTGAYAIPTVNGTAALHLAFKMAGVEHGQEVFCPSITFVATANAISYCGAIPHFLDNSDGNFLYNIRSLRDYLKVNFEIKDGSLINKNTNRIVKVLCVTHIFGFPAQMDELLELCSEFKLILVEDAAESLGSYYKGKHTGNFGLISATSFNGNKILTTGGGGAVLTPDPELAEKAKHLSTTARVADPYSHSHDEIGYNYRMPNINAALGCAQLEKLPEFLVKKRKMAEVYLKQLGGINEGYLLTDDPDTKSNNWLHSMVLESEKSRNALIDELKAANIHCRGVWKPMHTLPMYKDNPRMDCTKSEALASKTINLPSSPDLIDYISEAA